jgi:hypothetical protein
VKKNEKNLSAKKENKKTGAWFLKTNEHQQWSKCIETPSHQGQKTSQRLI